MGYAALRLAENHAASDNHHRGPTSRYPDLWHRIINAMRPHAPTLAVLAAQEKLRGELTPWEFVEKLKAAFQLNETAREYQRRWRRHEAKRLTIKRRRQAAKRAKKWAA